MWNPNRAVYSKEGMESSLLGLRNEYASIAFGGSSEGKSLKEIAKSLKKATLSHMAKMADSKWSSGKYEKIAYEKMLGTNGYAMVAPLLARSYALAKTLSKSFSPDLSKEENAANMYSAMKKADFQGETKKTIRRTADKYEAIMKKTYLSGWIEGNGEKQTPEIFYLVSQHGDCAEDHEEFQGSVYVDDGWKSIVKGHDKRKEINIYISKNHIKTFQWVLGKPVWMITRPNCRHYAESIPTVEVLSGKSVSQMLAERGMIHAIGPRGGIQTMRHSLENEWYTKSNVLSIIKQYEDRLALHVSLLKAGETEELKNDIWKDKLLIKKWKDYLLTHFR